MIYRKSRAVALLIESRLRVERVLLHLTQVRKVKTMGGGGGDGST